MSFGWFDPPEISSHLFARDGDLVFAVALPAQRLHHVGEPHGVSRGLVADPYFEDVGQEILRGDTFLSPPVGSSTTWMTW